MSLRYLFFLFLICSCSFSEPKSYVKIENAAAKPSSHEIAVSVSHWTQKEPTGFINTLPNGGIPKTVSRVAKIYVIDAKKKDIKLVEEINLLQSKKKYEHAWINGWDGDDLYFSLVGIGSQSRYYHQHYKLKNTHQLEAILEKPEQLQTSKNSGPLQTPPFLRYSKGHSEIELSIDNNTKDSKKLIKVEFQIENHTVKPVLKME